MISPPYDNKGISRYDKRYSTYRCCHCDGLAFVSYLDKLHAQEELPSNKEETRRINDESGNAYQLDYAQFIHYRCGVYVGPGRQINAEDLDLIYRTKDLTDGVINDILSRYRLTQEEIKQRFIINNMTEELFNNGNPDNDIANKIGIYQEKEGEYNLFSSDEIRKIHKRIYITEKDMQLFKTNNKNNVYIPEMSDPTVKEVLNYRDLLNIHPQCVRCDGQLSISSRGLRFIHNNETMYIHFTCYDIITSRNEEKRRRELYDAFDLDEQKRLMVIEQKWGYLPVNEYMLWKKTNNYERNTWAYKNAHYNFIQFYENRFSINK